MKMATPITEYENNCSLMAVREFADVSDNVLWVAFRDAGWKPGRGTNIEQWMKAAKECGLKLGKRKKSPDGYFTLAEIMIKFPQGNFLVQSLGHVCCMVNGKIVDRTKRELSLKDKIYNVIPVLNAKEVEL